MWRLTILFAAMMGPLVVPGLLMASDQPRPPDYVTSQTCKSCHAHAYETWQGSHHDWALKPASPETVLGDFSETVFEHFGVRSRFNRLGDEFWVETEGSDGVLRSFQVLYTVGVTPLQQYVVETEPGRLQSLDIAWDVEKKEWYSLRPDRRIQTSDGLHWSGTFQNWNSRCAECHSTGFQKNYNPQSKRYDTQWAELNVACESCHGPGEAHVTWAHAQKAGVNMSLAPFQGVGDRGLVSRFEGASATGVNGVCAACHSRRESLGGQSHPVNAPFEDGFNIALLRQGLYFPDGQIHDEVYVYGSFLQSKMHQNGVGCTDCHNAHSLDLRADGNAVCTQCHTPEGRVQFSARGAGLFDDPSHHHHQEGSVGAQCVSCHMPERTYMGVDPRRDHSFRVPRPDLTEKIGVPNACATCHADQTPQEAAAHIRQWFPDGQWRQRHFGEVFARARAGDIDAASELRTLVEDDARPAIIRASALDQLMGLAPAQAAVLGETLLAHSDALIRRAAVRAVRTLAPQERAELLLPVAGDARKSVRLEVASILMHGSPRNFSGESLAQAQQELQRYLAEMSDLPETQMKIAGLARARGNSRVASAALGEALRLDPHMTQAWLMKADLFSAGGDLRQAEEAYRQGMAYESGNANLHQHLGLLLSRQQRWDEAIEALMRAVELVPKNPNLLLDLAEVAYQAGRADMARRHLDKAMSLAPSLERGQNLRKMMEAAEDTP